MDVCMSIVASLHEIYIQNPSLTQKQLFESGLAIGKDMIGTMTNTLILAFTGSAFITLLVFMSYQIEFTQLFNSNYLTLEMAQGLCGTFGIVISVPITSFVSSLVLTKQ